MKEVFLICNAHIDPIWQWDWEEGAAVTLATFRSAADLCERFDYVFCHNESLIYEWTERYDPELFGRIAALIRQGKWQVMGGWYLQPDCSMPSAEGLIRQMRRGQDYFREKFGASCRTAVNVDSFGHSPGLPQLLKKGGYDSYVCCRPMNGFCDLPEEFVWEGVDGSRVAVVRAAGFYNQPMGLAAKKVEAEIARTEGKEAILTLIGIGNHGGGPSRKDLEDLAALKVPGARIRYARPEDFFGATAGEERPLVKGGLYPCFPGCYTSQIKIKQTYRRLESEYFATEKMVAALAASGLGEYPAESLREAERKLLLAEFHDVLAGTCVRSAMEGALSDMEAARSLLKELRVSAFMRACLGGRRTGQDEYPVSVFNPHPAPVEAVLELPVILADNDMNGRQTAFEAFCGEEKLPAQLIKEDSNVPIDWVKKVAVRVPLRPSAFQRIILRALPGPRHRAIGLREDYRSEEGGLALRIGAGSGLIESLSFEGRELLSGGAFAPVLYTDNEDPWGMQPYQHRRLGEPELPMRLADPARSARLCGVHREEIASVRLTESGPVFDEIECIFEGGESCVVTRYRVMKGRPEIEVRTEVHFREKNRMLKLVLPFREGTAFRGGILAGAEDLAADGAEKVFQNWLLCAGEGMAAAVLNDGIYAASFVGSRAELSLARGTAYTAHYIDGREILNEERWYGRSDQTELHFRFRLIAGRREEIEAEAPRLAQLLNEPPFSMTLFPKGGPEVPCEGPELSGDREILLQSFTAEEGRPVVRLFNASKEPRRAVLRLGGARIEAAFGGFEIKTFRLEEGGFCECGGFAL